MIDTLVREKIAARLSATAPAIPVGISNRHVHLAQQDVEALFGKGYSLTPFKPLPPAGAVRRPGVRDRCRTERLADQRPCPRADPPAIATGSIARRLFHARD